MVGHDLGQTAPVKRLAPLVLVPVLALVACDDAPKGKADAKSAASASAKPSAVASATPPKPKGMPELLVDPEGPYLGGKRVDMKADNAKDRLAEAVKALPINGQEVTLLVEKKAKTSYVAAVVAALGAAGAPKVLLKTDGRDDLPKELKVTPQDRVSSPAGCSVAAMVLKDLSTAVWPYKGGLGKRQRKGLAGPDLSHTGETLEKELESCDSTMAFFSADDEVPWVMAFNIGGTIVQSDKKKHIDTLVLLKEAPVAGRAIGGAK